VADAAVLDLVREDVLRPSFVGPAVRMALDKILADALKLGCGGAAWSGKSPRSTERLVN
jgi:hypothetical protein